MRKQLWMRGAHQTAGQQSSTSTSAVTGTASPQKAAIKNLGFPVPVAGAGLPRAFANVAAKASSRWRLERCADSCLLRSSDLASAVEAIDADTR